MPREVVEFPLCPKDAFKVMGDPAVLSQAALGVVNDQFLRKAIGDPAVLSQAALLLLLGTYLRGDDITLEARAASVKLDNYMEAIPSEDSRTFSVPAIRFNGLRLSRESAWNTLQKRCNKRILDELQGKQPAANLLEMLPVLCKHLYDDPTPLNAALLMEACLYHPDQLVQVAAAASYFDLAAEPHRLLPAIERGTYSDDELTCDVAATALARLAPEHERLRTLTQPGPASSAGAPSHTSLLIHGTGARLRRWWQPGGDFHNYLLTDVRPDLYRDPDRFEWPGGWTDRSRALGANDLYTWVDKHGLDGLDLFTHSYGGSIAMLASHAGMHIGKLVLLSCPVHIPKYLPDFTRVPDVVSIRVHLDLAILADRGGQLFRHPEIKEHVLPVWFRHSATHDPNIWQKYNVSSKL